MKKFKDIILESSDYRTSYLLLNGKKNIEVTRDEKFNEIRIKTDLKYLEDLKKKVFGFLKSFKFKKVVTQSDADIYRTTEIEIQFSDFKGKPKAVITEL